MKFTIILSFLVLFNSTVLNAQIKFFTYKPSQNIIYIEALGSGTYGSVNYERIIREEVSMRIGIGFHFEESLYLYLPVSLHYLKQYKNNNFLEIGIGYTLTKETIIDPSHNNSDNLTFASFSIGYRKNFWKNWMAKINLMPLLTTDMELYPWGGVSLGRRF